MIHLFSIRRLSLHLLCCGAVLALWAGCATNDPAPAHSATQTKGMAPAPADLTPDLLRVGDLVNIFFSGVNNPPAEQHTERIKDDGKITLPLIGPIQAAGITRAQLQENIWAAYVPNLYQRLTVTIGSEARSFYVEGMVKNPGRYQYAGQMDVLKCISAAGDFNDFAKKSKVEVTRADGTKVHVNCIDAQRHPDKNVAIYPDDRIYVPRRYF
jgi:polysaccharide export outer membrane protein